jgi:hypothetical protein
MVVYYYHRKYNSNHFGIDLLPEKIKRLKSGGGKEASRRAPKPTKPRIRFNYGLRAIKRNDTWSISRAYQSKL